MANSFDKLVNEVSNLVTENELSRKSKTGKKRRKRTKREQKLFNNTIKFILAKLWKDLNTVPVKETSFSLYQHYYSNNKRYTDHLGLAYRTFKTVYDTLCKLNYITMTKEKEYNPEKPEEARSRMHIPDGYLRDRLLGLSEQGSNLHPAITILPDINRETIILRNRTKKLQPYKDTVVTNRFRKQIKKINTVLSRHWPDLLLRDSQWPKLERIISQELEVDPNASHFDFSRRTVDRIFSNNNFHDTGRMYRNWWSEIPNKTEKKSDVPYRNLITLDGMPTTELDYGALGPNIFYSLCNKEIGDTDPYDRVWDGKHRDLIKKAFNAMVQASTQLGNCPYDKDLQKLLKVTKLDKDINKAWRKLKKKIRNAHPDVKDFFGQGYGSRIQFEDSSMVVKVLSYYADKDIPVLPVHDSLLFNWELRGTRDDPEDQMLLAYTERFKRKITIREEDMFKVQKPIVELVPYMGVGTSLDRHISMLEADGGYRRWTERHRAWLANLPNIASRLPLK